MQLNSRISSGAYLHACITSNSRYCGSLSQKSPVQNYPSGSFENEKTSNDIRNSTVNSRSALNIYPNPAREQFFINLTPSYEKPVSVIIGTVYGTVVISKEFRDNDDVAVPIADLPDGLCFVTIKSGSITETAKLI